MPIRIERFIRKRFGITEEYEDLPDGVLGFTKFGPRGVEAVVVSRALADDGSVAGVRRLSATFGHEAGHGLLHGHLFVVDAQPQSLFGDDCDPDIRRVLCRNVTSVRTEQGQNRYDGRWWEFQANQAMGALLLPRRLVGKCLNGLLVATGSLGAHTLPAGRREAAARMLADVFEVNPAVGRIRIAELYPAAGEGQLTL
jgi:hypothetical protein